MITFAPAYLLDPDQSPNSQNIDPSRSALSAVKRRGYIKHSRVFAAPSGTKISGLFRWIQNDGTSWSLATEGTKLWRYTSSAETDITGPTTLVNDALTSFAALNNVLVIAHSGVPQVWTGAGVAADLGGSPPADLTVVVTHGGRVFGIRKNSSILAFSAADDPQNWTAADDAGTINVDKSDGDKLITLASVEGLLYIFKRNSLHVLSGTSVDNFDRKRIFEEGAVGQNSVVRVGRYVFFASDHGIYMVNGLQVTEVSARIQNDYLAISGKSSIALGRIGSRQVWAGYSSTGGANDNALVLDYRKAVWARYTAINARMFANLEDGTLIGGHSSAVVTRQYDNGTNDDGAAINMVRETPDIYVPEWHRDKGFEAFWLLVERTGAYNVTVDVAFDGDTTAWTTLVPTLSVGSGTGLNYQRYVIPPKLPKFARFRMSNNAADQEITLHGYAVEQEVMESVR